MTAYLITGLGGSGKSTIAAELRKRGYDALDADEVPGLAGSVDLKTGLPTVVDYSGFVDYSKVGWSWDGKVLDELLARHERLFLCGSASNQTLFHARFTGVFVLTLNRDTHQRRLQTRDSTYGKNPAMMQAILDEQPSFVAQVVERGALPVDANQTIFNVTKEILDHVSYH